MAVVYGANNGTATVATTATSAMPSGITAGMLLISEVILNAGTKTLSVAAPWTLIHQINGNGGSYGVAFKVATGSDLTPTWSWDGTAQNFNCNVSRLSGEFTSAPIGAHSVTAGTGTAVVGTPISMTSYNAYGFCQCDVIQTNEVVPIPAGYTSASTFSSSTGSERMSLKAYINSGDPTSNVAVTLPTSAKWFCSLIEIQTEKSSENLSDEAASSNLHMGGNSSDNLASDHLLSDHQLSDRQLSDRQLSDRHLSDAHLSDALLSDRYLSDRQLSDRHLSDAHLSDRQLSDRQLSDRNLSDRNLSDRQLSDRHLSDAHLSDALLSDRQLSDRQLSDRHLSDAHLSDALLSDRHQSDRDLSDRQLSDRQLSDRHQSDRDLSDRQLSDRHQSDRDLSDRQLSDRHQSDRNLSDRQLSDRNLSDRQLSDRDLSDRNASDKLLHDAASSDKAIRDAKSSDDAASSDELVLLGDQSAASDLLLQEQISSDLKLLADAASSDLALEQAIASDIHDAVQAASSDKAIKDAASSSAQAESSALAAAEAASSDQAIIVQAASSDVAVIHALQSDAHLIEEALSSDVTLHIIGVTRDLNEARLGNCTVHLFRTSDDVIVARQVSDNLGNFDFVIYEDVDYYIVAYLQGSDDVAGTTINTLRGAKHG